MRQTNRPLNKILALPLLAITITTNIYAQAKYSYTPDGKDFVVVDGHNMFTKPLFACTADYCVKTSDIPIFKLSERGETKTLSFTITSGDKTYALGKAAHCESRYSDGARRYILSDPTAWGQQASIDLTVCPLTSREGAIMKFTSKGFAFDARISANIEGKHSMSWFAQSESYLEIDGFNYADHTQAELAKTYTIAQRWNKATAERIEINTPDNYINNVMGPLLSASHGRWDKYKWIDGYDYDANDYEYVSPDASEAAEKLRLSLAEFMNGSPKRGFNLLNTTMISEMYKGDAPANMPADATGRATRAIVQGLFGIQPEGDSRCIVRPALPREWQSASIRTPYIIYKFHKSGNKDIYEITQNFAQPHKIVIRQNIGNGQYRDIVGSDKKHQVISVAALAYPIDDAPPIAVKKHQAEDTIPTGDDCHEVKLGKGKKKPVASTTKGHNVGFDIKAKGKYSCAYLMVAGRFNGDKESGQALATYSDGSQETISIVNPSVNNDGQCLLKIPLDPSKKLKTVSIVALADDVEIKLERLILQE